jgi:hypothetical protein
LGGRRKGEGKRFLIPIIKPSIYMYYIVGRARRDTFSYTRYKADYIYALYRRKGEGIPFLIPVIKPITYMHYIVGRAKGYLFLYPL